MVRKMAWLIPAATLVLFGQAPSAGPPKPDSAEVTAHVAKAKKIGGSTWESEARFFCLLPRANSPTDPIIEPTKLFDNVYAIGRSGTVVYAITTPDGIILIDSGYASDVEAVLLAGMNKLGLDPARIKYLIVTHGHGDHFGGAAYLQEHYGVRVVLSEADWNLILNPPAPPAGKGPTGPPVTPPKKDMVAEEGSPITLGSEKVEPVLIPGHTPGSMGLIFDVTEGGKPHVAGLFGGTILLPGIISDQGLQQYLRSIDHFKEMAKHFKVDVELQNHPLYDEFGQRLAELRERKPGAPNPLIVGQGNYGKFLDVMSECMQAQIARRAE
jgi:metallo-beta-lactamase class B